MLPELWKHSPVQAWVAADVHAGHVSLDHLAVVVSIDLQCGVEDGATGRRRRFHPQLLLDPYVAQRVQQGLWQIPQRSWDSSVHDHAALLVTDIQRVLDECVPATAKRMRNEVFSDRSAGFHVSLRKARNQLRGRVAALRLARIRCAFLVWRHGNATASYEVEIECNWMRELHVNIAMDIARVSTFSRALRQSTKADKIDYVNALAVELDTTQLGDLHKPLRKLLKPRKFAKCGQRPIPALLWEDGTPCRSVEERRSRWRQYVSQMEAGFEISQEELLAECHAVQSARGARPCACADSMPNLLDLDAVIHGMQSRRAPGLDGIPAEVCKKFSTPISVLFWPVLLKMLVRSTEPVTFKGAELLTIPKGKGSPAACSSSRGIILQSVFAKMLHRATRGLMTGKYEECALKMQLGGRKGLSALFGSLSARAFLSYCKWHGYSAALIFFDISAAFYSVLRELVTGSENEEFSLDRISQGLHLEQGDLQALEALVREEPLLTGEGAGGFLRQLTLELHAATWFRLREDPVTVQTLRGTRPGSPWADVVFNTLFARVITRGRPQWHDESCAFVPEIAWNGVRAVQRAAPSPKNSRIPIEEVVFADDLAVLGAAKSAVALPKATATLTASILDSFYSHGLRPNMGPGKTSAVLAPHGAGSRLVRHKIFTERQSSLPVLLENVPSARLVIVPSYQHLGCKIMYSGSMTDEVKRRVRLGRAAFREGRKLVYCCKQVQLDRRTCIFRGHIMSIILHGAGTWPVLNQRTFALFSGAVISLYRQMLLIKVSEDQHWSRSQIISAVALPAPQVHLHVERLRFVAQLYRSAPDMVWALIQYDSGYIQGLENAFAWLFSTVASTSSLPDPAGGPTAIQSWLEFSRAHVGKWKGMLKRAQGLDIQQHHITAWFEMVVKEVLPTSNDSTWQQVASSAHVCLCCGVAFVNKQTWSVHAAKVHGYRARHVRLAVGRQCQACGRVYADNKRLGRHLLAMKGCLDVVEGLHAEGKLRDISHGAGGGGSSSISWAVLYTSDFEAKRLQMYLARCIAARCGTNAGCWLERDFAAYLAC